VIFLDHFDNKIFTRKTDLAKKFFEEQMFGLSLTHEFYAPFRTVQNCASFDILCGQFQRIFSIFSYKG
jgi:hypothetical protein